MLPPLASVRRLMLVGIVAPLLVSGASEIRVSGGDGKAIAAAVKKVTADGGGTVLIGPGEYLISEPILLSDARNVTLRGESRAVLKLAPMSYGVVAKPIAPGDAIIRLRNSQGFR